MGSRTGGIVCRLKEARQSRGLSQGQVAEMVGVKRQAIYDIESGRYLPNTEVALRLARHLGCRVEDLFSEEAGGEKRPVVVAGGDAPALSRVSLVRVRGRLVAYPVDGRQAFGHELRPADGFLEEGGRVRLFSSPECLESTVLLLGCDPAFSLLAAHLSRVAPAAKVACRFASSHRALEGLAAGHAHLAGTHLHKSSGPGSNVKLARERLAGFGGKVLGFSLIEEGLMVSPGNPRRIRSAADLSTGKARFVNREPGAALRILLDDLLSTHGIPGSAVKGYDRVVHTHNEGAQMVAYRLADAALGLRSVAAAFGLDFVPLAEVRCDLVVPGDMLEHATVRIILDLLQSRPLREEIASLPGYDSSRTGDTIAQI